jgi:hypothetical protein
MILDSQEVFSYAQSTAAFTVSDNAPTNTFDTGGVQDDGIGEELNVAFLVNTAFTSGGAATIQFVVQSSTDNATWTDLVASPVFAYNAAAVGAGKTPFVVRLPTPVKRYLRVCYRVAGAALTGGAVSSFLVKDPQLAPIQSGAGFTVS